ncbi:MAG TPA: hypothetical protein QGF35_07930 [Dehalococcoidia bacterium]|jgi:hypothetical protein|nr:hypothetical protein [Dehalococcoidia bacterium]
MRTAFVFSLGLISGAIAVVLLYTFNDAFDGSSTPRVGNVRLILDGSSLNTIVSEGLAGDGEESVPAVVSVRSDGTLLIEFALTTTLPPLGPRGSVVVQPGVDEGEIVVSHITSDIEGTTGEIVAEVIQNGLRSRLESIASETGYRVIVVATTGSQLTLDIEL